ALEDRGQWCLEAHGVRFVKTYLSRDRRRMVCLYEAADAESVRLAQEKAGMPFERVWTARVVRHAAPEPQGDAVIVERFLPQPVDESTIREMAARGASCLEEWGCRIVWSFLGPDGRQCVCVFAAPDAESVRQSQRRAGVAYEQAWPATVHDPPPAAS
ncbi:MAG TPA: nickel-binding protein, partial [Thermoanaerobaculia bacterium]|nr:nickel-binding protein [Thermoanaerobaculia bacterium]